MTNRQLPRLDADQAVALVAEQGQERAAQWRDRRDRRAKQRAELGEARRLGLIARRARRLALLGLSEPPG